ncbi:NADPH-dependent F420 reductase [Lacticaseibacillus pantheris]|uniref:NADPH-dependent F420 reductase n=1 Tax=Lacticaseibacillus pantheris TaxID=171523 RepID=UPI002658D13F|nr:diguanylate cyclase [Lacticaseibacillus pantheris]WKF85844.1 diguanylate cyclase [Lacticaseibacillus pantheris]
MKEITIFGKGNMGRAIGENFKTAGNNVNYIDVDDPVENIGSIIILAVPYNVALKIAKTNRALFVGTTVIDITNPLDFDTWDNLVVPADSSAAAQIANELPDSKVVKGFNTTFAATLISKKIGGEHQTTVQLASDHDDAKQAIISALKGSGLAVLDSGKLRRARELEAFGFLQMTLAASEKITWNGGFGVFN